MDEFAPYVGKASDGTVPLEHPGLFRYLEDSARVTTISNQTDN